MKLSWPVELVQLIVIACMFIAAGAAWTHVSDPMPVHWNMQGEVDGYGGKFVGLLLLPLTALGLYLLMLAVPLFDPGRVNYPAFAATYNVFRVTILLFFAVVYAVTVLSALGYAINMTTVIGLALSAMFIVLGNFMGKIRPNWFVGVRTPWTLSSKVSWTKTHRLAGWLFIVMGLAMAGWAVVQAAWAFVLAMSVAGVSVAWIVVYSYLVYRTDPARVPPAGTSAGGE